MAISLREQRSSKGFVEAGPEPDLSDADEALAEAAKTDKGAFAALWERYYDQIFRFCRYRLTSFEDAEDAADEVFAKALAGIDGYRSELGSFRKWLFAIAHNEIISRRRRSSRWQFLPFAEFRSYAASGLSTEEAALIGEDWTSAMRLLEKLGEEQRSVLILRWSGLTGFEIAEVLGKRHDAVRKIQQRAEARLRRLQDEEARHV